MKKLLKNVICGFVNSARVHCSQLTWSNSAAGKKKKNSENTAQDLAENAESFPLNPNGHTMSQSSRVGAVIRDDVGCVLAALSKNIPCALGPSECEAKAMEGVTFAWDMGFRDVVFECDSKVVSDSINGYCELPATIGNIIDGIKHKFRDFQQVLVSHMRR